MSDSEGLQGLSCEMDKLASRSVSNEEFVLDVPFSAEEVVRIQYLWTATGV